MKVLVTGASGFLGSHIAELLSFRGHDLRLLLRSSSSLEFLEGLEFERADGDIRDTDSLMGAIQGVDAIVHSAGLTSALDSAEYEAVNAVGTASLVQTAREAGIERFCYVSSLAALGPSPDGLPRPPEPAQPVSAYGRSKLQAEYAVRAERHRINVSVLRLPAIYGPRDRGFLPLFRIAGFGLVPVYGDGEHALSWIHVRDAATAAVLAIEESERSGSIFTACDGEIHTWRSLVGSLGDALGSNLRVINVPHGLFANAAAAADAVGRLLGRPMLLTSEKVVEMKQRHWVCDYALMEEELGWEPTIAAGPGLLQTLRWYRRNGWL